MSRVRLWARLFFAATAGLCWPASGLGWQSAGDSPAEPIGKAAQAAEPEWFQSGWRKVGAAELVGVRIEGQATAALAERELLEQLRRAFLEHLGFEQPDDPQVLPELSRRFVRDQLLVPERLVLLPYQDALTEEAAKIEGRAAEPYYRGYAEARLTPEVRALVDRWRKLPALRDSLRWLGVGSLGVLGAIAILFGYLKADHLTQSHYTRRLQTAALIALAGLAGFVFWCW